MFLNIEIKAVCRDSTFIRNFLMSKGADFKGTDQQVDTYFNVLKGRLKLRQGNIENNLIYYERIETKGLKESNFHLVPVANGVEMKELLKRSLGILVEVHKQREIYFIKNVKFHIDEVKGLGNFVEIEASNKTKDLQREELQAQCQFYVEQFSIGPDDLIDQSYSDMLMAL